jgi:hypothetical protein
MITSLKKVAPFLKTSPPIGGTAASMIGTQDFQVGRRHRTSAAFAGSVISCKSRVTSSKLYAEKAELRRRGRRGGGIGSVSDPSIVDGGQVRSWSTVSELDWPTADRRRMGLLSRWSNVTPLRLLRRSLTGGSGTTPVDSDAAVSRLDDGSMVSILVLLRASDVVEDGNVVKARD